MITSGPILMFEVSLEPYLSTQHDWIFENVATAFLVAKFWPKNLSVSKSFEGLLSWNSESKLITPKYITGNYFGAIVAIFIICFSVCFLCVMFFLTPEWAPKAGPCHLFSSYFHSDIRMFQETLTIFSKQRRPLIWITMSWLFFSHF